MSKKVKGLVEKELQSRFEGMKECIVVSLRGVDGTENNILRGDLLGKNINVTVVKNSLARRAFASLGMEGMKELLMGPCAIAYGGDSVVDVAKEIVEWDKKIENFEIKGGFLENQVLDAAAAKDLAKMPNLAELQGTVVMLAGSPGARLAGTIAGPAGYLAGCIKALVDKLQDNEDAEAA
jgi:large subunit ribosomal protein L10